MFFTHLKLHLASLFPFFYRLKSHLSLFISSISICASFSSLWLYYNLFKKYDLVKEAFVEQTKIIAKLQNENLALLLHEKALKLSLAHHEKVWENVNLGAGILVFLVVVAVSYYYARSLPTVPGSTDILPPVITPKYQPDVEFVERTTKIFVQIRGDTSPGQILAQCEVFFRPNGLYDYLNLRELLEAQEEMIKFHRLMGFVPTRGADLTINIPIKHMIENYANNATNFATDLVIDFALKAALDAEIAVILSTLDKL